MEVLRYGSRKPAREIGCCAVDIIQGFNKDPDQKAIDEILSGDTLLRIHDSQRRPLVLGPTYKDIFLARLRIGTFSNTEMPDHGFFAILTETQIQHTTGKKWLALLREQGFEFLRTINNSVYGYGSNPHAVHIFALFRNVSGKKIKDPFTPPKEWTDLPEPKDMDTIWKEGTGNLEKALGTSVFETFTKAEAEEAQETAEECYDDEGY